uniref:Uncharacterized protein n=1 Tax=Anguilla anguilla TaxID=7936 RepID=A0A0E9QNH2_ANGAN
MPWVMQTSINQRISFTTF